MSTNMVHFDETHHLTAPITTEQLRRRQADLEHLIHRTKKDTQ